MTAETNKATCRAFLEKVYKEGRVDFIHEVVASDAVDHELEPYSLTYMTTPQMIASFVEIYSQAFPDLQVEIEDMMAEEDRVATRWRMRGTHTGPLLGIDASGRSINVSGLRIDRFAKGKVVETWGSWDVLGMLEQIGAVPVLRRQLYPALRSVAAA
jgi:steroid delta-isomerase-like uncharacterized protein